MQNLRIAAVVLTILCGCAADEVQPPDGGDCQCAPDAFADAGVDAGEDAGAPDGGGSDGGRVALSDLGGTYKGFAGQLYPGANTPPSNHQTAGVQFANAIAPLDTAGAPSASGRYLLISIGMSNTTQEFCAADGRPRSCASWSFAGQLAGDTEVDTTNLVVFNGARGGQTAAAWVRADGGEYERIGANLRDAGYSELQVQAAWVKVANAAPTRALPDPQADAYQLERSIGEIARALKTRYPNMKMIFLSSRIYGGYATTALNPEPYAYESGFAVKWAIEAQLRQMDGGSIDPEAGDLRYPDVAPWMGWGPYLWADGTLARSDGLTWTPSHFEADGTHPSQSGEQQVGAQLKTFFKTSPLTRCWFTVAGSCP